MRSQLIHSMASLQISHSRPLYALLSAAPPSCYCSCYCSCCLLERLLVGAALLEGPDLGGVALGAGSGGHVGGAGRVVEGLVLQVLQIQREEEEEDNDDDEEEERGEEDTRERGRTGGGGESKLSVCLSYLSTLPPRGGTRAAR